jgi:SAM-dependent methyltransferase
MPSALIAAVSRWLRTARHPLVPPRRLIFVGGTRREFLKFGERWRGLLAGRYGMKPSDRVLDVGCGVGRIAVGLTEHLRDGAYEGIDIVADGITWCQQRITPRFPNFRFQLSDVYNKTYHPQGRQQPSAYRFPFADGEFDFAFLTSVFTHMRRADVANYLAEIRRVLRPGGRCVATFFLLNPASLAYLERTDVAHKRRFSHPLGDGTFTSNAEIPEVAIAYPEEDVRTLVSGAGLALGRVDYGTWAGREADHGQDVVFATRP